MNEIVFRPIGYIESPFKEKFGIPRQFGQCPSIKAKIILNHPFNKPEALKGLDTFTHIIVFYTPHKSITYKDDQKYLSVRPPRLGGNEKIGVFASRSPIRPNPLAFSIVKLDCIQDTTIFISNHDFLDKTPVLDIKPYIKDWDMIDANNGWMVNFPLKERLKVTYSKNLDIKTEIKQELTEILSLDPKPSYQENKSTYAFKYKNYDIKFIYINTNEIQVDQIIVS